MAILASTTLLAQQFVPVKGIINARDLGGYSIGAQFDIKDGLLIRSAHLANATDADLAFLENIHVAKVIDFRREEELSGVQDRDVPGARYISLPIDASGSASATATEAEKKQLSGKKKFDVKKVILFAAFNKSAQRIANELYPTLLFYPDCQKQFAAFLREVVDTPDGAIIFHCTQGKDRTGIASMLLLAALGADRETIIADFDATNLIYEKDVRKYTRRVRFMGGKEEEIAVVKAFLGANTDNFIKALDAAASD